MSYLSTSAKEALIQKVLTRNKGSAIQAIAKAHNIGYSTLQRWVKCYQDDSVSMTAAANGRSVKAMPLSVQFQHLIATASLNDTDIGVYCREHGIFSFQLQKWKEEFMTQHPNKKQQDAQSELKSLRIENKQLKQDLRRKDSALAETAALLILQKKTALIWGEAEGD